MLQYYFPLMICCSTFLQTDQVCIAATQTCSLGSRESDYICKSCYGEQRSGEDRYRYWEGEHVRVNEWVQMQETDHPHELDKNYSSAWLQTGRLSSCQSRIVQDKRRFTGKEAEKKNAQRSIGNDRTDLKDKRKWTDDALSKIRGQSEHGWCNRPWKKTFGRVQLVHQTLWIINKCQKKVLGRVLSGFSETTRKAIKCPLLLESLKTIRIPLTFKKYKSSPPDSVSQRFARCVLSNKVLLLDLLPQITASQLCQWNYWPTAKLPELTVFKDLGMVDIH